MGSTNLLHIRLVGVVRHRLRVGEVGLVMHRSGRDGRTAVLAVGRMGHRASGLEGCSHVGTTSLVGQRAETGLRGGVAHLRCVVWRDEVASATTCVCRERWTIAVCGLGRLAAQVLGLGERVWLWRHRDGAGLFCSVLAKKKFWAILAQLLGRVWVKLTFGSALSLPPPKTGRPGRVGSVSGFPPLEMGVGMGDGEWAGEATRGLAACGFSVAPWG